MKSGLICPNFLGGSQCLGLLFIFNLDLRLNSQINNRDLLIYFLLRNIKSKVKL
jgi:hypothetical protein